MSPRVNRRNYYRILHVQPDAPAAVLKSSYRALMLSLEKHPDRGGDHWDAALINEAYAVLSNPATRVEYDRSLVAVRFPGEPPVPPDHFQHELTRSTPAEHEPLCCVFCGAERTFDGSTRTGPICLICKSPLTMVDAPHLVDAGRRASARVAREGDVRYYAHWPEPTPRAGRIVDLSPTGLQFESATPLDVSQIIKIDGTLLDAVGRVVACRKRGRQFAVGIEFYTRRFNQSRGTFVSTTA